MASFDEQVAEVLDKAQHHLAYHKQAIGALRLLKDEQPRSFVKIWIDLLNRVLVQSKKHQSVERLVKLVSLAGVSFDESFRDFTIKYVIRKSEAREWGVRFRACQILSQTLKSLPEDAELGDAVWDEIYIRMKDRLDDRTPAVRAEAVGAVQRLQDPSDPDDPIVRRFIEMMQEDPSGDVRKTVVCNAAICKATLKEIVARTRDVHAPTRRSAFRVLANYVNIRNLKIAQRTQLLADGLKDRDEKVQRECSKMCLSWLANVEGDVLELLRLVDLEVAEEGAVSLLLVLFRDATGGCPVRVDPSEKLSSEAALYMRVIAEFWRSKTDDRAAQDAFENQVPELLDVCKMMEMNTGNDFVLKQLLLIASMRDFSEEMGRCSLSSLLRSLLPSPQVSQFLVEPIIKVLAQCHSDEQEFIQVVLEMVSDVREPLDLLQSEEAKVGFQKAIKRRDEMRITYAKLRKIARISAKQGNTENVQKAERKAHALRKELDAAEESINQRKQVEEHIWYRILCVTELMLENTRQGARHPGLHSLLDGILMPSLAQEGVVIREKALRCLAMYCLLDRTASTVQKHIKVFLDASVSDDLEMRLTAVKSLFDIGMLYGFNCIDEEDLVSRLSKYVTDESEDQTMRGMVAEGFAKLYLMGQCQDTRMFAHLLLLFFAPSTASDLRLRQCLSVFFPTFAFSSRANQKLCCEASVPAMRRILLSDPTSSFRKIDWTLFSKFMAHLTETANATYTVAMEPSEPSFHEQIILQMAFEMRAKERSWAQYWARSLPNFAPRDPHVPDNEEATASRLLYCAKLYTAVSEAANMATDKRAKQWTEKRAVLIRNVIVGGALGEAALSDEVLQIAADKCEIEMVEYLEQRQEDVAEAIAMNNNVFTLNDEISIVDEDGSPAVPKKKERRKVAAVKAKPAAQQWGIFGGQQEKRNRQQQQEQQQQGAVGDDEIEFEDVDESPPKKEKTTARKSTRKSARKRREADDEDFEADDESPPKKEKITTVRKSARKRKDVAPIIDISSEEEEVEPMQNLDNAGHMDDDNDNDDDDDVIEEEDEEEEENKGAAAPPASPWKQTQSAEKRARADALSPINK